MRPAFQVLRAGRPGRQSGQAMTEFVISATYVLIPLFIAIPLLAKYVDIKQAAVQAARYEAWEYTVWYEDTSDSDHDILVNYDPGVTGYQHPEKSRTQVRNEARNRYMLEVDAEDPAALVSTDMNTSWDSNNAKTYWRDHRGLPLFEGTVENTSARPETPPASVLDDQGNIPGTVSSADTPDLTVFGVNIGQVMDVMLTVVDTAFSLLATVIGVLDAVGDFLGGGDPSNVSPEFSAINTEGYSRTYLDMYVNTQTRAGATDIIRTRDELGGTGLANATNSTEYFNGKASVLSDGWNAGGTNHTYMQVNGGTPSVMIKELLDIPGLNEVWQVISFIAPELTQCYNAANPPSLGAAPYFAGPEGNLWFGYVDGDVVNPDRLSEVGESPANRLGVHSCDDSGRCTFTDVNDSLDAAGMTPLGHSPCIP